MGDSGFAGEKHTHKQTYRQVNLQLQLLKTKHLS